ncbi:MAG: hypothetical protein ACRDTU_10790 [Micromonosporaceae bacterium]
MSTDRSRELLCTSCVRITSFEQPRCSDGHGSDCAEWSCTRCGAAILVGPYTGQVRQIDRTAPVRVRRAA